MSLTEWLDHKDDAFKDSLQNGDFGFIPVVNIGGSIHGKYRKRPKVVYIRATNEVLSGFLNTEDGRQKLLKWLRVAVLNGLDKEK